MNILEISMIQSLPAVNIGRGQDGLPKSLENFGGVRRAYISSQAQKKAVRAYAKLISDAFGGIRTKHLFPLLMKELTGLGVESGHADLLARSYVAKMGEDTKNGKQLAALIYISPAEVKKIATRLSAVTPQDCQDVLSKVKAKGKDKESKKETPEKVLGNAIYSKKDFDNVTRDAVDIAFFGRMVANAPDINIDGACMVSFAVSTHECIRDFDFFTAVDDLQKVYGDEDSQSGAAHLGESSLNSACYYRYWGLNLDLLRDNLKSSGISDAEFKKLVKVYAESVITALPNACQNSKFGKSLPSHVFGVVREGSPISLLNAFENPVEPNGGYIQPSIERLNKFWNDAKTGFGLTSKAEKSVTFGDGTSISDMLDFLIAAI